jgi:hypothetical protein
MATHELKTWSEQFKKVLSGEKTFELRKNDRDFKTGDTLILIEGDLGGYGMTDHDLSYFPTGRELKCSVTHVLYGGRFGLPDDHCIMSIKVESPAPIPASVEERAKKWTDEDLIDAMTKFAIFCNSTELPSKTLKSSAKEYFFNHLASPEARELSSIAGASSLPLHLDAKEVQELHEKHAELRSLKQSILESRLKDYFPKKDMSFHDKVVLAIDSVTSLPLSLSIVEELEKFNPFPLEGDTAWQSVGWRRCVSKLRELIEKK